MYFFPSWIRTHFLQTGSDYKLLDIGRRACSATGGQFESCNSSRKIYFINSLIDDVTFDIIIYKRATEPGVPDSYDLYTA